MADDLNFVLELVVFMRISKHGACPGIAKLWQNTNDILRGKYLHVL